MLARHWMQGPAYAVTGDGRNDAVFGDLSNPAGPRIGNVEVSSGIDSHPHRLSQLPAKRHKAPWKSILKTQPGSELK
jgi:hypothetical protein